MLQFLNDVFSITGFKADEIVVNAFFLLSKEQNDVAVSKVVLCQEKHDRNEMNPLLFTRKYRPVPKEKLTLPEKDSSPRTASGCGVFWHLLPPP